MLVPPRVGIVTEGQTVNFLEQAQEVRDCWCKRLLVLKNSVRRRVFPQGSFFRFVFFLR